MSEKAKRRARDSKSSARRHWPRGLASKLKKLGFAIRRRPLIGVARCLSQWADDQNVPVPTIYVWRIEKRDSGLKTARSAH
jgi:hypothetical protein